MHEAVHDLGAKAPSSGGLVDDDVEHPDVALFRDPETYGDEVVDLLGLFTDGQGMMASSPGAKGLKPSCIFVHLCKLHIEWIDAVKGCGCVVVEMSASTVD